MPFGAEFSCEVCAAHYTHPIHITHDNNTETTFLSLSIFHPFCDSPSSRQRNTVPRCTVKLFYFWRSSWPKLIIEQLIHLYRRKIADRIREQTEPNRMKIFWLGIYLQAFFNHTRDLKSVWCMIALEAHRFATTLFIILMRRYHRCDAFWTSGTRRTWQDGYQWKVQRF